MCKPNVPEQMSIRPLHCLCYRIAVLRSIVSQYEHIIELSEYFLLDGRRQLLSLTLFGQCCMMKHTVYLSDTEGPVPTSATERGVTNR